MIAFTVIKPNKGKNFIFLFEQSPFSQTNSFMILPINSSMISLKYFFGIEVDHQPAKIVSRLWLCRRSKSLRLPSWNWPQLDVSGQRRSQGRPSHPDPDDNGLTSNSSIVPGIPPNLVNPSEGCRFYDRCPEAMEKCKKDPPKIKTKSGYVLCWLYE